MEWVNFSSKKNLRFQNRCCSTVQTKDNIWVERSQVTKVATCSTQFQFTFVRDPKISKHGFFQSLFSRHYTWNWRLYIFTQNQIGTVPNWAKPEMANSVYMEASQMYTCDFNASALERIQTDPKLDLQNCRSSFGSVIWVCSRMVQCKQNADPFHFLDQSIWNLGPM